MTVLTCTYCTDSLTHDYLFVFGYKQQLLVLYMYIIYSNFNSRCSVKRQAFKFTFATTNRFQCIVIALQGGRYTTPSPVLTFRPDAHYMIISFLGYSDQSGCSIWGHNWSYIPAPGCPPVGNQQICAVIDQRIPKTMNWCLIIWNLWYEHRVIVE